MYDFRWRRKDVGWTLEWRNYDLIAGDPVADWTTIATAYATSNGDWRVFCKLFVFRTKFPSADAAMERVEAELCAFAKALRTRVCERGVERVG